MNETQSDIKIQKGVSLDDLKNFVQFGGIILAIAVSTVTAQLNAKSNNDLTNQRLDTTNEKIDNLSKQIAKKDSENDFKFHDYDGVKDDVIRLKERVGITYVSTPPLTAGASATPIPQSVTYNTAVQEKQEPKSPEQAPTPSATPTPSIVDGILGLINM